MPGTKNPTAPQSANTAPAMQAYPTMTIPAEIAHQFTCRRGSEGFHPQAAQKCVTLLWQGLTCRHIAERDPYVTVLDWVQIPGHLHIVPRAS